MSEDDSLLVWGGGGGGRVLTGQTTAGHEGVVALPSPSLTDQQLGRSDGPDRWFTSSNSAPSSTSSTSSTISHSTSYSSSTIHTPSSSTSTQVTGQMYSVQVRPATSIAVRPTVIPGQSRVFQTDRGSSAISDIVVTVWSTLIGPAPTLLRYHWSRAFLVILTPSVLCHKD